jgi:hypothetical protein
MQQEKMDAVAFTIRIRKDEFDALFGIAQREGCSVKVLARRAIQSYVRHVGSRRYERQDLIVNG